MELGDAKGVKSGRWLSSEMMHYEDINFLAQAQYQFAADVLAVVVEQGVATGSTPDVVAAGMLLEHSTLLTCNLRAGAAVSFSGAYYNSDAWGFVPSAGRIFVVFVAEDTPIAFDVGGVDDRIDVVEVRPVLTPYNSTSRQFKDPVTKQVTSAITNTRYEHGFEFQILKGVESATPSAPSHTAGWIKVAEVYIAASASSITQSNIKDVRDSATWTTEAEITKLKNSVYIESLLDAENAVEARTTLDVYSKVETFPQEEVTCDSAVAVGDLIGYADGVYFKIPTASPQEIASSVSPTAGEPTIVTLVAGSLYVFVWRLSNAIKARAASLSGDTLTFGTTVDLTTTGSILSTAEGLDSTHLFIMFRNSSTGRNQLLAASVASLTITPGSAVDLSTSGGTAGSAVALSSSKIFATWNNTSATVMRHATVSGTTISLIGSETAFSPAIAAGVQTRTARINSDGSAVVVSYRPQVSSVYVWKNQVITTSGDSPVPQGSELPDNMDLEISEATTPTILQEVTGTTLTTAISHRHNSSSEFSQLVISRIASNNFNVVRVIDIPIALGYPAGVFNQNTRRIIWAWGTPQEEYNYELGYFSGFLGPYQIMVAEIKPTIDIRTCIIPYYELGASKRYDMKSIVWIDNRRFLGMMYDGIFDVLAAIVCVDFEFVGMALTAGTTVLVSKNAVKTGLSGLTPGMTYSINNSGEIILGGISGRSTYLGRAISATSIKLGMV